MAFASRRFKSCADGAKELRRAALIWAMAGSLVTVGLVGGGGSCALVERLNCVDVAFELARRLSGGLDLVRW